MAAGDTCEAKPPTSTRFHLSTNPTQTVKYIEMLSNVFHTLLLPRHF